MTNTNNGATMKCYNRDVTFYVDDVICFGTIQYIANYGTTISARNPFNIPKGKKIRIYMSSQNQIEVRCAEVAYADESSFGAKFV